MLLDRVVELTLAVYRVTKTFPEGEVLIGQIRKTANKILAGFILREHKKASDQIKILLYYFRIAKVQNWTKKVNFAILSEEYKSLLVIKKKIKIQKKLSQRQAKILNFIKKRKTTQLKDLTGLFPKLSPRTIRSELSNMVQNEFLIRQGKGRNIYYTEIKRK